MAECNRIAFQSGCLNSNPRRGSADLYSLDLLSDPSMRELAEQDSKYRRAVRTESPTDMVLRLMPSDGHLS